MASANQAIVVTVDDNRSALPGEAITFELNAQEAEGIYQRFNQFQLGTGKALEPKATSMVKAPLRFLIQPSADLRGSCRAHVHVHILPSITVGAQKAKWRQKQQRP